MQSMDRFTSRSIGGAGQPSQRTTIYLLALGLLLAFGYIVRLRRELLTARQRGDMYRDIAAALDRQHAAE